VAEDTPENLTRRLRGSEALHVEVRGPRGDVLKRLRSVPQVLDVRARDGADGRTTYAISSEIGADLRETIAATVVGAGWGLLELRPLDMSLEEIFLKLTTTEVAA
jgi:ABC-2 type transport system ATP-binding protein